jgi:hypothetical protein
MANTSVICPIKIPVGTPFPSLQQHTFSAAMRGRFAAKKPEVNALNCAKFSGSLSVVLGRSDADLSVGKILCCVATQSA